MLANDDVAAVVQRCRATLGDPTSWAAPPGYPNSLALCAIDSIWSIGIRYSNVERVVGRYREAVESADEHNLTDLLASMDKAGGTDAWRAQIGTRHLTSSRGGIFKSDALALAAQALIAVGINSTDDLRNAADAQECEAEQAWRAVRGQRSGVSWHYLQLLSGVEDVKPDRMIIGFLKRSIASLPSPQTARALVFAAAAELGVTPRTMDHRIWSFQSGRG